MADHKQLIAAACALSGDPAEAVLSSRLAGDTLFMVVDRGIAGAPKLEYNLSDLQPQAKQPEAQPEAKQPPATPEPPKRQRRRRATK